VDLKKPKRGGGGYLEKTAGSLEVFQYKKNKGDSLAEGTARSKVCRKNQEKEETIKPSA